MAQIPTYQQQEIKTPTPTRGPVPLGGTVKLSGQDHIASALGQVGGALQDVGKTFQVFQEKKDKSLLASAESSLRAARGQAELDYDRMAMNPKENPQIAEVSKEEYVNGQLDGWSETLKSGWKKSGGSNKALDVALLGYDQSKELNHVKYEREALKKEGEATAYRFKSAGDEMQRQGVVALRDGDVNEASWFFDKANEHYDDMVPIVGPEMRDQLVRAGRYNAYQTMIGGAITDNDVDLAEESIKDDKTLEPQQVSSLLGQTESQRKNIEQAEKQAITAANTKRRNTQTELSLLVTANEVTHRDIQLQMEEYKNRESDADPRGITENYGKILQAKLNRQISKDIPKEDKKAYDEFKRNIRKDNAQLWWSNWREFESEKELNDFIGEIRKSKSLTSDQKFMTANNALLEYELFANPSTGDSVRNAVTKMYEMEAKCISLGIDVQFGSNGNSFLKSLGKDPTPEVVAQKAEEQYKAMSGFYTEAITKELGLKPVGEPVFDPITAPVGTERQDKNGVVWKKRDDGKWEEIE